MIILRRHKKIYRPQTLSTSDCIEESIGEFSSPALIQLYLTIISDNLNLLTPSTPPSEQLVTVSGGGGLGYRHL